MFCLPSRHLALTARKHSSFTRPHQQDKDVNTVNRELILMRHGQPNLTMSGKVSLVDMQLPGHGFMNRMIGKQLEASGWTRQMRNGNRYWSAVVYQMHQT